MAEPLPDGWVDTGRTVTAEYSGKVRLLHVPFGVWSDGKFNSASLGPWELYDVSAAVEPDSSTIRATGFLGTEYTLESIGPDEGSAGGPEFFFSSIWSVTESWGPFRLGVRYTLLSDPDPGKPWYCQDYMLEYAWFADEDTVHESTLAGHTETENLGAPGSTPSRIDIPPFGFAGGFRNADGSNDLWIEFTDIIVGGVAVDTSELDETSGPVTMTDLQVRPSGTGDTVTMYTAGGAAGLPHRLIYDLDVLKNSRTSPDDSTHARLVDTWVCQVQLHSDSSQKSPQAAYLTVPYQHDYTIQNVSWETHQKIPPGTVGLSVQSAWAAAQDPVWRADDRVVPWFGAPARSDPGPALDDDDFTLEGYEHPSYTPVSLTHLEAVSVHRPDGDRPSDWTLTAGGGSVTEGANTVFHAVVGSEYTRNLVSKWRNWIDPLDPDFVMTGYEVTKHDGFSDPDQDVWGWESYGYLRLEMDAPTAGTLALAVAGVWLEVDDNHKTGSIRVEEFETTEHPFTVTYEIPLDAGANDVFIDLLWPASGATPPFYYGRVDSLKLSGFGVGDYTLSRLDLQARGDTYLKCDWGPPLHRQAPTEAEPNPERPDYSALGWASGGSWGAGNIPDQLYKPSEVGAYGGNLRYVDPLTGDPSGLILDQQDTLPQFTGRLSQCEGWEVVYTAATYEGACGDGTNLLGPQLAQWIRPVVPFERMTPGTPYLPKCSPQCKLIAPVNGIGFVLYTRWPLGFGGIEAVVVQGDHRAPSGVPISARRTDTLVSLATQDTDAYGYVVSTPVPANGELAWELVRV